MSRKLFNLKCKANEVGSLWYDHLNNGNLKLALFREEMLSFALKGLLSDLFL